MIKKGSKVIVKKPLKVLEVNNGIGLKTVTVKVEFRNSYGVSLVREVELPRSYVKEYKKGGSK